jgi:quinol monooxygenase YgiN
LASVCTGAADPRQLVIVAESGANRHVITFGGDKKMINVLAIITAKPGKRDEVLAAFRANVPAVKAEQGCIEYGAAVDAAGVGGFQTKFGDDAFVVIERWESLDALKAHAGSPHMAAYGAKTKELLASRVIHVLSPS